LRGSTAVLEGESRKSCRFFDFDVQESQTTALQDSAYQLKYEYYQDLSRFTSQTVHHFGGQTVRGGRNRPWQEPERGFRTRLPTEDRKSTCTHSDVMDASKIYPEDSEEMLRLASSVAQLRWPLISSEHDASFLEVMQDAKNFRHLVRSWLSKAGLRLPSSASPKKLKDSRSLPLLGRMASYLQHTISDFRSHAIHLRPFILHHRLLGRLPTSFLTRMSRRVSQSFQEWRGLTRYCVCVGV